MTSPSSTLATYLGADIHANRPATPNIAAGTVGLWWSTDTKVLSAYDLTNAAWNDVGGSGGGYSAGTPPTIVQTAIAEGAINQLTMTSAPTNGNLLVAICINGASVSAGSGWTLLVSNSSGDVGGILTKTAGAGESTTQAPLASLQTGVIMIWELHGQSAAPVIFASMGAEQTGLVATLGPSFTNLTNCLALGGLTLESTSNNIVSSLNMAQDKVINTGTVRQGVMAHSTLATCPTAQQIVTFSGAGTPSYKGGLILVTS